MSECVRERAGKTMKVLKHEIEEELISVSKLS